jgi:hypothetical protein
MAGQEQWERVARDLGVLVTRFLEEFADTCRGSDHDEEAGALLRRLSHPMGDHSDG